MNIQTRSYGENQVVISAEDLKRLIEIVEKIEPVEIVETDFNTQDLMHLAESGGALDFLHDEREDVYTVEDLKVKYK